MNGTVYLIGAGPGDPELITLKALNVIKKADVIIYDRLIPKELLDYAPIEAEKIYVGKIPQKNTITQDQINQLLVQKAKEYNIVVRLKGGDPLLFGRGGEEIQYLHEAQILHQVIPGITSVQAASASFCIPFTHRKIASSIAIVTGHEDPSKEDNYVNWHKIAKAVDTIIILMGIKHLKMIIDCIIASDIDRNTKVAIIENVTKPGQRIIIGNLNNIINKAAKINIRAPSVIIIGKVVNSFKTLVKI
ncbi:MAG: uroporphyrinogen-III C-methyltransferase [Candidatus Odinarchaeota archaeon]